LQLPYLSCSQVITRRKFEIIDIQEEEEKEEEEKKKKKKKKKNGNKLQRLLNYDGHRHIEHTKVSHPHCRAGSTAHPSLIIMAADNNANLLHSYCTKHRQDRQYRQHPI